MLLVSQVEEALKIKELSYASWVLFHSCIIRYFARDDGRDDWYKTCKWREKIYQKSFLRYYATYENLFLLGEWYND